MLLPAYAKVRGPLLVENFLILSPRKGCTLPGVVGHTRPIVT